MKKQLRFYKYTGRMTALCLSLLMACSFFTGCGRKEIALTTGVNRNEAFKIDGRACSMDAARLLLVNVQRDYEKIFGNGEWERKLKDVPLEDYVKGQALKQASQMMAMAAMAERDEISLSEEEQKQIESAAKEYVSQVGKDLMEELDFDQKDVEELYRAYLLANREYDRLIQTVNSEISDDEARVITIEYALFSKTTQDEAGNPVPVGEEAMAALSSAAASVVERTRGGESFSTVARELSGGELTSRTVKRGELEEALEQAAFALSTDEVGDPVEGSEGIYVIHCTSNNEQEATAANKTAIYEQRCRDAVNEAYEAFLSSVLLEQNTEQWEKETLPEHERILTMPDLFSVYEQYVNVP